MGKSAFHSKTQLYFFIALMVGVFAILLRIFVPYFSALILAITFAVIVSPLYKKLVEKMKGKRVTTALLTVFLVVVVILVPLIFFSSMILREAQEVYSAISTGESAQFFSNFTTAIETKVQEVAPNVEFDVDRILGNTINWFAQHLGTIFSGLAQVLFTLFLSLMALYYLLKDGRSLTSFLVEMSPLEDKYDYQIILKLRRAINSTIRGSLLIAVIQGFLTGLGFAIFGIPNAALWGSTAVLSSLIPTVGTSLVIFPAIVYLIVVDKFILAVGLMLWGVLIVGLVDNFLRPQFIKQGIELHPFLILLSVLGGIGFFGPIGFLAGPIFLSFFFALLDIYQEEFMRSIEKSASET